MKKLILVRHGHSEYMAAGLTGGWTNLPLTERGKKEAHYTGRKLQSLLKDSPYQFYSSDLLRATETAYIIGKMLSKKPILVEPLRELNNGIAQTLTRDEAQEVRLPVTEPLMDWISYPGAESWRMLHTRVTRFLDALCHKNDTVLVVAHSLVIISAIHWWLEFGEDIITRVSYDIDPCSITQLRINRWEEKTIAKLNDTSHLAALNSTERGDEPFVL